MKYFGSIFLLFLSLFVRSQKSPVEVAIDSNLTVVFPFPYEIKESDSTKALTSTGEKIEFIVSRQLSQIKDESKEEFDSSMQTYQQMIGTQKITSDFKKIYTDTILGGTHGLFISLQNAPMKSLVNKLYIFYTTKDYFAYYMFAKLKDINDTISEQQAVSFFKQLHFTDDYYSALPDTTFGRRKYNTLELIIGWVTALSVLSYLAYSMFKKKTVI